MPCPFRVMLWRVRATVEFGLVAFKGGVWRRGAAAPIQAAPSFRGWSRPPRRRFRMWPAASSNFLQRATVIRCRDRSRTPCFNGCLGCFPTGRKHLPKSWHGCSLTYYWTGHTRERRRWAKCLRHAGLWRPRIISAKNFGASVLGARYRLAKSVRRHIGMVRRRQSRSATLLGSAALRAGEGAARSTAGVGGI